MSSCAPEASPAFCRLPWLSQIAVHTCVRASKPGRGGQPVAAFRLQASLVAMQSVVQQLALLLQRQLCSLMKAARAQNTNHQV